MGTSRAQLCDRYVTKKDRSNEITGYERVSFFTLRKRPEYVFWLRRVESKGKRRPKKLIQGCYNLVLFVMLLFVSLLVLLLRPKRLLQG